MTYLRMLAARVPCALLVGVELAWGGLISIRSTPAGKACVISERVRVRASMGRRVSHPSVASRERRRGCRLCSRASLRVLAVCASGSMSPQVYEATAWSALRTASSHVAMPPQSSTMWRGLWGKKYSGVAAREEGDRVASAVGIVGPGFPVGGVC